MVRCTGSFWRTKPFTTCTFDRSILIYLIHVVSFFDTWCLIALAPLWMYLLATILGIYHNVTWFTCHASIYIDLIMFYYSDVPWRARASPAHPLKSCIDVCVLQYALWTGSHIFSFANHFGSKQYRTWPQPSFQLSHCCDSAVLQSPQRAIECYRWK
jgi:hypothetical protein